jgi:hypothetical protein
MMEQPENKSDNPLTSIHGKYTLSNTSETDDMMIRSFLEALADISLKIASRIVKSKPEVNP